MSIELKSTQVKRTLPVRLTSAEKASIREKLADTVGLRHATERELSNLRKRLASLQSEEASLSEQLTSGIAIRDVVCAQTIDYTIERVTVVRLDTQEPIEDRELTASERQLEIPDGTADTIPAPPPSSKGKPGWPKGKLRKPRDANGNIIVGPGTYAGS